MIAYIIGVLVVALGVALSIALHEIGHLVPAKKFGVKVTQYMVGFGPTIWSRQKGETEYGVKAIPLGGYIRMIGMFPPKPGDAPGQLRASTTGRFSQLMDQARQDSMDEVQPGDEHRVFYQLSVPKKVVVMMGGPVMNLLIAFVLFGGILTLYGIPTATPLISSVATCVPSTAPTVEKPQPDCAAGDAASPASIAGLQKDDRIVSVNGTPVSTWDQVTPLIRRSAGRTMTIVVDRGGSQVTLEAPIAALNRAAYVDNDKVKVDANGNVLTEQVGYLGATPSGELVKGTVA
ncbi:MAG: site-2 protease family protein, partial [Lapillicoccus sp.]